MKRISGVLKIGLAATLAFLPLVVPLQVEGNGIGGSVFLQANITNDEPIPAVEGYVPEMLFHDDFLIENPETEIFQSISATNFPTGVASGLVQLVLEPIASTLPAGVTHAQARAAAFNSIHVYHDLFTTSAATSSATGVNGMFGRDLLFLGQTGNRFRVMQGGFVGYVPLVGRRHTITVSVNGVHRTFDVNANAEFIPFGAYPAISAGSVLTTSHYVNRNGELFRYLTNNVTTSGGFTRFLTGPAPSWMTQNVRYYSYDGVYFYRNPRNIRENGSGAVNANQPFFNYFQYLSFRSHSTVTAAELDNFLINQALHGINTSTSVMRNQGSAFIAAQNRYGINALLMYAKAMHESAGGTSSIARNNNNLFGLGAFDATPGQSASRFATPADSVSDLANGWLSRGYLWPEDWRYAGPHAGHKGSGMNVRYATDPYWGQKIAGWAFRIDRSRQASTRDFNHEQIGIRQTTATIAIQNTAGATLYTANRHGFRFFPFLITGSGTNNRLRVQTDPALVNGMPNRTALYDRVNSQGYIPNNSIWLTGASTPSAPVANNPGGNSPGGNNPGGNNNVMVTTASANFRQGPGSTYDLISVIPAGESVTLLAVSANGIWSQVRFNNVTGWIGTEFLGVNTQPPVTQPPTTAPPGTTVTGATTTAVNLRRGSGTTYSVIRVLPSGTSVTVLGTNANGTWSQVRAGNDTGWVSSEFLNVTNNTPGTTQPPANTPAATGTTTTAVNLRRGSGTTYSIIRVLPNGTSVTVLGTNANGTWTQVRAGNDTGWVSSEFLNTGTSTPGTTQPPANTPAATGTTTTAVNLRRGSATTYSVIRVLPNGTSVTVLGTNGAWTQVRAGNDTGWVSSEFLNTGTSAPGTTQPPANTPAVIGTTTTAVNLRRGSATTYSVIRVLPNGTSVTILGMNANGTWTQVRIGNDTGWVSSEFLNR